MLCSIATTKQWYQGRYLCTNNRRSKVSFSDTYFFLPPWLPWAVGYSFPFPSFSAGFFRASYKVSILLWMVCVIVGGGVQQQHWPEVDERSNVVEAEMESAQVLSSVSCGWDFCFLSSSASTDRDIRTCILALMLPCTHTNPNHIHVYSLWTYTCYLSRSPVNRCGEVDKMSLHEHEVDCCLPPNCTFPSIDMERNKKLCHGRGYLRVSRTKYRRTACDIHSRNNKNSFIRDRK